MLKVSSSQRAAVAVPYADRWVRCPSNMEKPCWMQVKFVNSGYLCSCVVTCFGSSGVQQQHQSQSSCSLSTATEQQLSGSSLQHSPAVPRRELQAFMCGWNGPGAGCNRGQEEDVECCTQQQVPECSRTDNQPCISDETEVVSVYFSPS